MDISSRFFFAEGISGMDACSGLERLPRRGRWVVECKKARIVDGTYVHTGIFEGIRNKTEYESASGY